jgi:hypothetical protein
VSRPRTAQRAPNRVQSLADQRFNPRVTCAIARRPPIPAPCSVGSCGRSGLGVRVVRYGVQTPGSPQITGSPGYPFFRLR